MEIKTYNWYSDDSSMADKADIVFRLLHGIIIMRKHKKKHYTINVQCCVV